MFEIRFYTQDDCGEINRWLAAHRKPLLSADLFNEESTMLIEVEGVPAVTLTIYFTNCKGLCVMEHFIGNPDVPKELRKEASQKIVHFMYDYAASKGYKNVLGFATHEKLLEYYKTLGMTPVSNGITSVIRRL